MGWLDKAAAAARLAAAEASKAGRQAVEFAESEYGSDGRYVLAREAARAAREGGQRLAQEARELAGEVATDVGGTEWGAKAGQGARTVGGIAAKMPLVTAITDAAKARHGVDRLLEDLKANPTDPERALWLAEALDRVQRDMLTYRRVRSVTSLTYALRQQAIASAMGLGEAPSDDAQLRLLKTAYRRSSARVKANPLDAGALHVMARVHLAQQRPDEAARLAKLAVLADASQGLAWVTLARAYMAMNQPENAQGAAKKAVSLGAGYGNTVLAALILAQQDGAKGSTIAEYERLRSLVKPSDQVAYLGTSVDGLQVLKDLHTAQSRKASEALAMGGLSS